MSLFGVRNSGRTLVMLEAAIRKAKSGEDAYVVMRDERAALHACDQCSRLLIAEDFRHRIVLDAPILILDGCGSNIYFNSTSDEAHLRGLRFNWRGVFMDHACHEYSL